MMGRFALEAAPVFVCSYRCYEVDEDEIVAGEKEANTSHRLELQ